jgi:hypothetical protein
MQPRARHTWSRLALGGIVATLSVCLAVVARTAWQRARAATAFASLLHEANRVAAFSSAPPAGAPTHLTPSRLVVLVRDVRNSSAVRSAYHVQTGLDWPVAFAASASDATLVLLVDRIYLNVRSYRPIGDDYQVVLHGTLVQWPTQRVLRDFVVRGPRPGDRAGLISAFGLFAHTGAEPWAAAGAYSRLLLPAVESLAARDTCSTQGTATDRHQRARCITSRCSRQAAADGACSARALILWLAAELWR